MERRSSLLDKVDGALFAFAGASAGWLAYARDYAYRGRHRPKEVAAATTRAMEA
jgi:hypothetical protein